MPIIFFSREIESQQDIKSESFYEEDKRTSIVQSKPLESDRIVLDKLTRDQVTFNDFDECEHVDIGETPHNEATMKHNEMLEVNQDTEQNPEIYLAQEDAHESSVETVETQVDNMSTRESVANSENEHIEQEERINSEQTSDDIEQNIGQVSNEEVVTNQEPLDVGNSVPDAVDGNQEEPMEIEETHTTDVITTVTSAIRPQNEVIPQFFYENN